RLPGMTAYLDLSALSRRTPYAPLRTCERNRHPGQGREATAEPGPIEQRGPSPRCLCRRWNAPRREPGRAARCSGQWVPGRPRCSRLPGMTAYLDLPALSRRTPYAPLRTCERNGGNRAVLDDFVANGSRVALAALGCPG